MGRATYNRLTELLTRAHGITLTDEESTQMREVFDAFQIYGPSITTRGGSGAAGATA